MKELCAAGIVQPPQYSKPRLPRKKCVICGEQIIAENLNTITCSKRCLSEYKRRWAVDNHHLFPNRRRRSLMEQNFAEWLAQNFRGRWFSEVYFRNKEAKMWGWADFVFPAQKLIIELDGSHHRKNRAAKDMIRDEYLLKVRGYTTLRITAEEYAKNVKIDVVKILLGIGVAEGTRTPIRAFSHSQD